MADSRLSQIVAVVVAILFGAATYLALTEGMQALRGSDVVRATGPGNVPEFIYEAPNTVPTTADYGPVGPVAVVFAGTEVLTGLTGRLENPWVAVSSQTGAYRALSVPHSPEPSRDAIAVSPDGRMLAWGYDDGVVLYDPVEDQPVELEGVVDGSPLVGPFSPDGSRLLVYDGALHVLDVGDGRGAGNPGGSRRGRREAGGVDPGRGGADLRRRRTGWSPTTGRRTGVPRLRPRSPRTPPSPGSLRGSSSPRCGTSGVCGPSRSSTSRPTAG